MKNNSKRLVFNRVTNGPGTKKATNVFVMQDTGQLFLEKKVKKFFKWHLSLTSFAGDFS